MQLVDTHCHIQSAGLAKGERTTRELWAKAPELTPEQILKNADAAGVTRRICVGCDLVDSQIAIDFVEKHDGCWASIGIHPHEAGRFAGQNDLLDQFATLATRPKVVAIGECGLDYFYEHSPKQKQQEILKFQLNLAKKHDLPLIFHVREAFDEFWPIFDEFVALKGEITGVLHSFTDTKSHLDEALARGLFIGVNGIATFAKKQEQLDVYKAIPSSKLLLETDAPFLTPTPYRGSINEPKYVGTIVNFMAELRRETPEQLAEITTDNARKLFGI
jgi:TatD DNase family protein